MNVVSSIIFGLVCLVQQSPAAAEWLEFGRRPIGRPMLKRRSLPGPLMEKLQKAFEMEKKKMSERESIDSAWLTATDESVQEGIDILRA
jgi:hypothetical protein